MLEKYPHSGGLSSSKYSGRTADFGLQGEVELAPQRGKARCCNHRAFPWSQHRTRHNERRTLHI